MTSKYKQAYEMLYKNAIENQKKHDGPFPFVYKSKIVSQWQEEFGETLENGTLWSELMSKMHLDGIVTTLTVPLGKKTVTVIVPLKNHIKKILHKPEQRIS